MYKREKNTIFYILGVFILIVVEESVGVAVRL